MKKKHRFPALALPFVALGYVGLPAQSRETPDEITELSPFVVSASSDRGYQSTETLAGGRLKSSLRDTATQVTVMTAEFLEDLAIANLDEALAYSLNAEAPSDTVDYGALANAATYDTFQPASNQGRGRSIGFLNRSHDFFDYFTSADAYNTERITFSSGPNSILFGNADPAGTVDTTFKRAMLNRPLRTLSYQVTEGGGYRAVADINQPIVKRHLGLRLVGLREDQQDWRKPGFKEQERLFASIVYELNRKLNLRGWYEVTSAHLQPVRPTLFTDHVTPWVYGADRIPGTADDRAPFNNQGAGFPAAPVSSAFVRLPANANARPYVVFDETGAIPGGSVAFNAAAPNNGPWPLNQSGKVGYITNAVWVRGFDTFQPPGVITDAQNRIERSFTDSGLYPLDVALSGNGNQSRDRSWTAGAILELNPAKNLYFELGYNQERWWRRTADYINLNFLDLYVDPNLYLQDEITPNPNYGRYYVELQNPFNQRFRVWREEARGSVAYDFDFKRDLGLPRWLGRHRLQAMLSTSMRRNLFQVVNPRILSSPSMGLSAPTTLNNYNSNARSIRYRYYLTTPGHATFGNRGSYVLELPFDPLTEGVYTVPGTDVTVASFNNPYGEQARVTGFETRLKSRVFTSQSYFLRDRVVVTYGVRADNIVQYLPNETPTSAKGPGFATINEFIAGDNPLNQVNDEDTTNRLRGLVVNPTSWLSLFYNDSTSRAVGNAVRIRMDGSAIPMGGGDGKEFGTMLSLFNNRFFIRATHYETNSSDGLSSLRNANTAVPASFGAGNAIKDDVFLLERTALANGASASGDPRFAAFEASVAAVPLTSNNADFRNLYDMVGDIRAKGIEVTLTGNPTPRLTLTASFAKAKTAEDNIGIEWFQYIEKRLPVWDDYLAAPIYNNSDLTMGQLLGLAATNWNYIRLSNGRASSQEREFRANFTARYQFNQGRLNGLFAGGNYSWRSAAIIGYHSITVTDNPYLVPGVTSSSLTVADFSRPIRGDDMGSVNAFIGYRRSLFNKKIRWSIQLNISNLFDDQDLQSQRALVDGTPVMFSIPAPRTFRLSNSITF